MKKQVILIFYGIFLSLFLGSASVLFAQTDSLRIVQRQDSLRKIKNKGELTVPTRAALLSAALPGLGQYRNKKLWYLRIPIIYAGLGFFGFNVRQNHGEYIRWRDALLYKDDGNPLTRVDPKYSNLTSDRMQQVRDNYRRERDYNIILSILFYGLNIAEAATTAHLLDFDVSDDLNVQIRPASINLEQGGQAFGVKITIPLDRHYISK